MDQFRPEYPSLPRPTRFRSNNLTDGTDRRKGPELNALALPCLPENSKGVMMDAYTRDNEDNRVREEAIRTIIEQLRLDNNTKYESAAAGDMLSIQEHILRNQQTAMLVAWCFLYEETKGAQVSSAIHKWWDEQFSAPTIEREAVESEVDRLENA